MKLALKRCVFFALLLCFFALPVAAQETELDTARANEEYGVFLKAIPPEIAELLPESFFSSSLETGEAPLREAGGVSAVFRVIGKLTGLAVGENLALLAKICGLLLLAAVARTLASERGGGVGKAYSFCTTLAMAVLLLSLQRGKMAKLEAFFNTVMALCAAILPMMGTLYAMGGNLRRAVLNHGVLSSFLAVLETLCAGTMMPLAGICLANGSDRLSTWFESTSFYGEHVAPIKAGEGMTMRAKVTSFITICALLGFGFYMMRNTPAKWILVAVVVFHAWLFFVRLPTREA